MSALSAIRRLLARHCPQTRRATPIAGLTLFRAEAPTALADAVYRPSLCVTAQGRNQVSLAERTFACDEASYLIAGVDIPVRGRVLEASAERPFLGLHLELDPAVVAEVADGLESCKRTTAPAPEAALVRSRMSADLLDAIAKLLGLLDAPLTAPVLGPPLEREIHYRLLQGERADVMQRIAAAGSHLSKIRKATDWLRSHYADRFSSEALAHLAGLSVASFHRHFKAITLMSPLQYRTRIRLQEARRMLVSGAFDVGSARLEVGYESASQFARDYRKMFGLPPAMDAARLRAEYAVAL